MNDFARLEDKLAKLRQRERAPGEGRKLRGGDADALLTAIVTEIDETILPRRLTFTPEDGPAIHLAVANRKLQALLSPAPNGIDPALADQELPDADDPKVASLVVGLRNVLASAESLKVSSVRPKNLFASDVGVPTSQLRRVWGVEDAGDAKAVEPTEILAKFLSGLDDDVIAWLRIDGETVSDQGGDAAEIEALGATAALFLDGYFSKFETAFPEPALSCATVIAPSIDQPAALFFVEFGEHSAVVSARPDRVLAIATAWQKLIAE